MHPPEDAAARFIAVYGNVWSTRETSFASLPARLLDSGVALFIAYSGLDKLGRLLAAQLVDLLPESLNQRWMANAARAGPTFGSFWELEALARTTGAGNAFWQRKREHDLAMFLYSAGWRGSRPGVLPRP